MLVVEKRIGVFFVDDEGAAVDDAADDAVVERWHRIAAVRADNDGLKTPGCEIRVDAIIGWVVAVTNDQDAGAHRGHRFIGRPCPQTVGQDSREFGYYEITPTSAGEDFLPKPIHVVQSHFHSFDLPDGATHLATSVLYPNQAFRYGANTYGLQFHAEVTIEGFRRWQAASWAAYGQPGVQTREQQDVLMLQHDFVQAIWFYDFLGELFGSADPTAEALIHP